MSEEHMDGAEKPVHRLSRFEKFRAHTRSRSCNISCFLREVVSSFGVSVSWEVWELYSSTYVRTRVVRVHMAPSFVLRCATSASSGGPARSASRSNASQRSSSSVRLLTCALICAHLPHQIAPIDTNTTDFWFWSWSRPIIWLWPILVLST